MKLTPYTHYTILFFIFQAKFLCIFLHGFLYFFGFWTVFTYILCVFGHNSGRKSKRGSALRRRTIGRRRGFEPGFDGHIVPSPSAAPLAVTQSSACGSNLADEPICSVKTLRPERDGFAGRCGCRRRSLTRVRQGGEARRCRKYALSGGFKSAPSA